MGKTVPNPPQKPIIKSNSGKKIDGLSEGHDKPPKPNKGYLTKSIRFRALKVL